jgi:hypothetical protein
MLVKTILNRGAVRFVEGRGKLALEVEVYSELFAETDVEQMPIRQHEDPDRIAVRPLGLTDEEDIAQLVRVREVALLREPRRARRAGSAAPARGTRAPGPRSKRATAVTQAAGGRG